MRDFNSLYLAGNLMMLLSQILASMAVAIVATCDSDGQA